MLKHQKTSPIRDATRALAVDIKRNISCEKSDGKGGVFSQYFTGVKISQHIDSFTKPYDAKKQEVKRTNSLPACSLSLPEIVDADRVYQTRSALIELAPPEDEPETGFIDVPATIKSLVFDFRMVCENAIELTCFMESFVRHFSHKGTSLSVFDSANNVTDCLEVMLLSGPSADPTANNNGLYIAEGQLKICAIALQHHTAQQFHTVREINIIPTRQGYTAEVDAQGNVKIIEKAE